MGFFSWKKSDDNETIYNRYSSRGATPCVLLDDQGNRWECSNYDGYGVFGGVDYYALLCEMNTGEYNRNRGITLEFSGETIKRPKLVSPECLLPWDELPDSPMCDTQGFDRWGL